MGFKYSGLKNKKDFSRGFTLAEMVVVAAIFSIMAAIILFNYDSFKSNSTINNVAQEIALTARKAQAYSLGFQTPYNLINFDVRGYGIRIEPAIPNRIMFFTELSPNDDQYTSINNICGMPIPGAEECLEYFKIDTGDLIKDVYYDDGSMANIVPPGDSIDIVFRRPTGDAVFCHHRGPMTCSTPTPVNSVDLVLVSKKGTIKKVHIYANGQISVE